MRLDAQHGSLISIRCWHADIHPSIHPRKHTLLRSPGTYVFDFNQNAGGKYYQCCKNIICLILCKVVPECLVFVHPIAERFILKFITGWVRFKIAYCPAGTRVQFRHAELLQHPPYGPIDGNIYVGNLRSAKATDVYICSGNPDGEEWQPTFTQHGFRYVEVTGLPDDMPPTMEMLTFINVRSAVEQTGTLSTSDPMFNNVQHNILWGQQTNLMMIPTDCDQRDERLGWTGDSALTSEEALSQFDLGAFFHNWASTRTVQKKTNPPRIYSREHWSVASAPLGGGDVGGRSSSSVTSRRGSLLLSVSADARSAGDVTAFEGQNDR